VSETIGDHMLYGLEDLLPVDAELSGDLFPGKESRPMREKEPEGFGDRAFAFGPWQMFHNDAVFGACDSSPSINNTDWITPHGYKLKLTFVERIVSGCFPAAFRTLPLGSPAAPEIDEESPIRQAGLIAVNKTLDRIAVV